MSPKFTYKDHQQRMRELLNPKPKGLGNSDTLQTLLSKAREKRKV